MCKNCGCNHVNYEHSDADYKAKYKNALNKKSMNFKSMNNTAKVFKNQSMSQTNRRGKK